MRRILSAIVLLTGMLANAQTGSAAATGPAAPLHVPPDGGTAWAAFFASGPLEGSGWAACPAPITLTVDSVGLPRKAATKAARAIVRSLQLWEQQTGLSFEYTGVLPVVYDDRTGVITPADGVERRRHLYLALITDAESSILSDRVVGLGEPTSVDTSNREITSGEGTFEVDYVRTATATELVALFTHELGHALGLGHSANEADVMYPIVSTAKRLGPGDIAGIKTVTRACDATADPSRDYPVDGAG